MEEGRKPRGRNKGYTSAAARLIAALPPIESPDREEVEDVRVREERSGRKVKVREDVEWKELTESLEELAGAYERRLERQEMQHKGKMEALRMEMKIKNLQEIGELRRRFFGDGGESREQRGGNGPREAHSHQEGVGEERRFTN